MAKHVQNDVYHEYTCTYIHRDHFEVRPRVIDALTLHVHPAWDHGDCIKLS